MSTFNSEIQQTNKHRPHSQIYAHNVRWLVYLFKYFSFEIGLLFCRTKSNWWYNTSSVRVLVMYWVDNEHEHQHEQSTLKRIVLCAYTIRLISQPFSDWTCTMLRLLRIRHAFNCFSIVPLVHQPLRSTRKWAFRAFRLSKICWI